MGVDKNRYDSFSPKVTGYLSAKKRDLSEAAQARVEAAAGQTKCFAAPDFGLAIYPLQPIHTSTCTEYIRFASRLTLRWHMLTDLQSDWPANC